MVQARTTQLLPAVVSRQFCKRHPETCAACCRAKKRLIGKFKQVRKDARRAKRRGLENAVELRTKVQNLRKRKLCKKPALQPAGRDCVAPWTVRVELVSTAPLLCSDGEPVATSLYPLAYSRCSAPTVSLNAKHGLIASSRPHHACCHTP